MTRLLTSFVLVASVALAPLHPAAAPERAPAEMTRKVLFSAVDAKGTPVTDLIASDLTVKEGGKDRVIATLKPASGPLQVSILVDDGGLGSFQAGVLHFISRTLGRAEYAISMLNPTPLKLVDYTSDPAALQAAVLKLVERGRLQQDGMQLIEAISWSARELKKREAQRPVIIALTNGGEPGSSEEARFILNDLKDSAASLHVVYINGLQLGQVLNEGPKYSGGLQSNAASTQAMNDALSRVASTLFSQFELTYTLPDGTKPNDRLQLQTTRKGVTLIAPQRIPDR
jgi:hypothetical protein